jgi:hypothetical protein
MSKKYEEEMKKETALTKQIAMDEVKRWIEKMPQARKDKPEIIVGTKVFTPNQLAKEVEQDTEYGKRFGQMLNRVRLDLAKKGK